MPAIKILLAECGVSLAQLNKIAVTKGPGSYTGLRIGVTVAKTLAWDRQIPICGISSLAVMAQPFFLTNLPVVPLIDARRGNVYGAIFEGKKNTLPEQHIALSDLLAKIKTTAIVTGHYSAEIKTAIQQQLKEKVIFAPIELSFARASVVIQLAGEAVDESQASFVPHYLKLAEAESNWLEARNANER